MLVLSRKRDKSITIGDNIIITVVDIRGDKVRLGIDCPSEIPVHRREVYDAIQRENLGASRLEGKKPAEYVNSKHYNPFSLCPNLDFSLNDIDSKLERVYV